MQADMRRYQSEIKPTQQRSPPVGFDDVLVKFCFRDLMQYPTFRLAGC